MRAAAALAVLALAGCGKPEPKVFTVTMADMAFGQAPPELHVGDSIEWRNVDVLRHTATARNGAFDVDLPPKASARTVFRQAGTIDFYCRYHPGMTGRLTVAN